MNKLFPLQSIFKTSQKICTFILKWSKLLKKHIHYIKNFSHFTANKRDKYRRIICSKMRKVLIYLHLMSRLPHCDSHCDHIRNSYTKGAYKLEVKKTPKQPLEEKEKKNQYLYLFRSYDTARCRPFLLMCSEKSCLYMLLICLLSITSHFLHSLFKDLVTFIILQAHRLFFFCTVSFHLRPIHNNWCSAFVEGKNIVLAATAESTLETPPQLQSFSFPQEIYHCKYERDDNEWSIKRK